MKTNTTNLFHKQLILGAILILLVLLFLLPVVGVQITWLQKLFTFFVFLSLAQIWNLLAGFGGMVSLAQPAFLGFAAYTMAICLWLRLPIPAPGLVILGGVLAALLAVLVSVPVFRFGGGLYFAIGTLLLPTILSNWFNSWTPDPTGRVGAGAGFSIRIPITIQAFYWIGLIVAIMITASVFILMHSKYGLGIRAIRDDSGAALSSGVGVFRVKFYLFVFGAFLTGLVGVIYYMYIGYIEPQSSFNMNWTVNQIVPVVLGVIGTLAGPFLGTIVFIVLYYALSGNPSIDLFIWGGIVVIMLLIDPEGIMGLVRKFSGKLSAKRLATKE